MTHTGTMDTDGSVTEVAPDAWNHAVPISRDVHFGRAGSDYAGRWCNRLQKMSTASRSEPPGRAAFVLRSPGAGAQSTAPRAGSWSMECPQAMLQTALGPTGAAESATSIGGRVVLPRAGGLKAAKNPPLPLTCQELRVIGISMAPSRGTTMASFAPVIGTWQREEAPADAAATGYQDQSNWKWRPALQSEIAHIGDQPQSTRAGRRRPEQPTRYRPRRPNHVVSILGLVPAPSIHMCPT